MKYRLKSVFVPVMLLTLLLGVFVACDQTEQPVVEPQYNLDKDCAIVDISNGTIDERGFCSMELDYSIERLDLSEDIHVRKGYEWDLYADPHGQNKISSKVITDLKDGNNTFYIVVRKEGESATNTHVLNIWKNFYTYVNFFVDGQLYRTVENVLSHTYFEDFQPVNEEGYTFNGWGCERYYIDKKDVEFHTELTANKYTLTLDADGGEVESATKDVTYNELFELPIPTKPGYEFIGWTYDNRLLTNAKGESKDVFQTTNDLTFKAKWVLSVCQVTAQKNIETAGEIEKDSADGKYDFGSTYSFIANTNLGYTFEGWYLDDELICADKTLTFTVQENEVTYTAKWKIADEMSNYEFSSTANSCQISGVKDKSLSNMSIPYYVTEIMPHAFEECLELTSIIIPPEIKRIPSYAFYRCVSLKGVVVCDGVEIIDNYAFESCYKMEYLSLPNSVTSIGLGAFDNCKALKSLTIPSSVTSIGRYAFMNCAELTSIVVKPGNTKYHSDGDCLIDTANKKLLLGCSYSVIPTDGSVTNIESYAFYNVRGLTNIAIPNGIEKISDYAFEGCGGLTSVTIPSSVTEIEIGAFYRCNGIAEIVVEQGNTSYHSEGNCLINTKSKELILGCGSSIIPTDGSMTSIGKYAFAFHADLTSISIPDCVISIGFGAFEYSGLTSVTIPESVIYIGGCVFNGCASLTTVEWNLSVSSYFGGFDESHNAYLFGGCKNLTMIIIGKNVTVLPKYVFYGCDGLTSIVYGGTIEEWNNIDKGECWNDRTGEYTIYCTDGDIEKA